MGLFVFKSLGVGNVLKFLIKSSWEIRWTHPCELIKERGQRLSWNARLTETLLTDRRWRCDRTVITVLLQCINISHITACKKWPVYCVIECLQIWIEHTCKIMWNLCVQSIFFTSSCSYEAQSVSHMSDMLSYLLLSILSSKWGFVVEECTGWSEKCLLISSALLGTLFQQKYVTSS